MVGELRVTHQKIFGGADQALLFACVDTLGGATEACASSIAHLDEYQLFTGAHDQIKFTTTTTVIARHAVHAARAEKRLCVALPTLTRVRPWKCWRCFSWRQSSWSRR